ncbi:MAG: thioether cross-link-forming SCIFF peptide maturase [Clostridiales bacterium]|nr:thioether cross-link-forming SCIFF peptide maturase [Clostridiales bacterium]
MIHSYCLNGYHVVVDAYSCSVHAVDEVAAVAISLYERQPRAAVRRALAEAYPALPPGDIDAGLDHIDMLRNAGRLYAPDRFAAQAGALRRGDIPLKALCLHVAHTCNLRCSYCFAAQGRYAGDHALMSAETGRRALDFLVARSGVRRNLEVDFFGGEPLMNWEVVKELVRYGRALEKEHDKVFRFTLTTNGMLLDDEVTDFCNREMHNVVLSLDGRKQVHDRFRVDAGGQGSYDTVVPKFQRFVKARGDRGYYIRGTYTRHNADFLADILHMADLGFTQLSMEPAVGMKDSPDALREEDLPQLYDQYERLAAEMIRRSREGRGFTFYHYMLDLQHAPCIQKRVSGCGAGTEYLAVTPWGDLYPCHQFVGDGDCLLGNIHDGITNRELFNSFRQVHVYARPECADCWAKLFCSGGCTANAYHASGDVLGVDAYGCRLFKKRLECALMMQAALADDEGENEG